MDETWRGRRNVLHTTSSILLLHTVLVDSELIRCYTLARARVMFVSDLIDRHANISDTVQKCHSARDGSNHYINYINLFSNLKNVTMQQWWFGSVTTFYKKSEHTNNYSTFRTVLRRCSFQWRLIIDPKSILCRSLLIKVKVYNRPYS